MRRSVIALAVASLTLASAGCDGEKLLGPDAAQGVEGLVLIGPQCPVETPEGSCDDQPYQAFIDILDDEQFLVTRVQSGADGTFRVGLEPGIYVIAPEQGDPVPTADEKVVSIQEGVWATVVVNYDSGIR